MTTLLIFPGDRFLIISAPTFLVGGVQIIGPARLQRASWQRRPIGTVDRDCILFDGGTYLAPDSLEIMLMPQDAVNPQIIKFFWLLPVPQLICHS